MSIKEQYNMAYSLLRSGNSVWDLPTYKLVTSNIGIDRIARNAALRSYSQSRQIDEIGESYRNLIDKRLERFVLR